MVEFSAFPVSISKDKRNLRKQYQHIFALHQNINCTSAFKNKIYNNIVVLDHGQSN